MQSSEQTEIHSSTCREETCFIETHTHTYANKSTFPTVPQIYIQRRRRGWRGWVGPFQIYLFLHVWR